MCGTRWSQTLDWGSFPSGPNKMQGFREIAGCSCHQWRLAHCYGAEWEWVSAEINLTRATSLLRALQLGNKYSLNKFPIWYKYVQEYASKSTGRVVRDLFSLPMYIILICIYQMIDIYIYHIKNNAWVTVNNDFLVTSGKSPHEWPKSLFTVTNVLFHFLHAISYLEHTVPRQTIIDRSFHHCR